MTAKNGFNILWGGAYGIGIAAAVAYLVVILWYGKKRAAKKLG